MTGVELVTADETVRDEVRAVHEAWRVRRAGEIRRRPGSFDVRLGLAEDPWEGRWKGFLALHRDEGGAVDGFARYKTQMRWTEGHGRGVVEVEELYGLTDEAYAALWRFLAEMDLVATVKADGRPVDERLPWLVTNARAVRVTDLVDGLWVRLFDVPRALAARTYAATASLVLEVVITGSYNIELSTPTGLLSTKITAGDFKRVELVVNNTGSSDLNNIKFELCNR